MTDQQPTYYGAVQAPDAAFRPDGASPAAPGAPVWGAPPAEPVWGRPAVGRDPAEPVRGTEPVWGNSAPVAAPGGSPRPATSWKKIVGIVVVTAAIVIGGVFAVTAAKNANSSTTAATAGAGGFGNRGGFGGTGTGGFGAGRGAVGGQLAQALHGDFVVAAGTGTATRRLQTGSVTAVSATSLTVKSTDGYTSTYVVPSSVAVTAATSGSTVTVLGTVAGATVTLISVSDSAAIGQNLPANPNGTGNTGGQPGGQGNTGTAPGGPGTVLPAQPAPTTA